MIFNGEEEIGIGGGKLPSSSPSKKFGGMLHPPPPKFKELREFLLLEGRGTKPCIYGYVATSRHETLVSSPSCVSNWATKSGCASAAGRYFIM